MSAVPVIVVVGWRLPNLERLILQDLLVLRSAEDVGELTGGGGGHGGGGGNGNGGSSGRTVGSVHDARFAFSCPKLSSLRVAQIVGLHSLDFSVLEPDESDERGGGAGSNGGYGRYSRQGSKVNAPPPLAALDVEGCNGISDAEIAHLLRGLTSALVASAAASASTSTSTSTVTAVAAAVGPSSAVVVGQLRIAQARASDRGLGSLLRK